MKPVTILISLIVVWLAVFTVTPFVGLNVGTASASSPFGACNSNPNAPSAAGTPVCQDVNSQSKSNNNVFISIIRDVINIIAFIVGVASVFIIIISGIKMITASGDTNALKEAKGGIIGAVIGLLVVSLAESFVAFVLDRIK